MPATILCVEDEEDLRKDIVEELNDAGYATIEAENGKVALEAIIEHGPDLVVSDITMPIMDGHQLLEELRSNHPDKCDLPFLFLSALADREHLVKGKKLGADDYLTKPVDYEMLLVAVEARLEQAQRVNARQQEQLIKVFKAAKEMPDEVGGDAQTIGDRLQRIVTATPTTVVAGRIQMLGLDAIKAALGNNWKRRREVIFTIAERIIKKRLGPQDICQYDGDNSFTLYFDRGSESDAAFKAQEISEDIHSIILTKEFGEEDADLAAELGSLLKELGTEEDADAPAQALEVQSEAHAVEIGVDEVNNNGNLLGLLASRMEAAANRSKQAETDMLIDIADNAELRVRPIENNKGEVTPFGFATLDDSAREKVDALCAYRPASPQLLRDLDVLLLTKVAEEILSQPPGKNFVIVMNVHFSTIGHKAQRTHFTSLCETLPDPARAAIVFNVVDIPSALLSTIVAEHFHIIRNFARAMLAQICTIKLGNIDPQILRAPILSIKASDLRREVQSSEDAVTAFIETLRQKKLRLFVHDAMDSELRTKFKALGLDLVTAD